MLDARQRPPAERAVLEWVDRWPERRTFRELVNFLVIVHDLQTDHTGDPVGYVHRLLDGGTKVGLEMAMTEAIAYLVATLNWGEDWGQALTRYHEELDSPFVGMEAQA